MADLNDSNSKDSHPTIILKDSPEQEKYERLKEKLRYKQALRENARKIDHKEIRLSIQAGALSTKTFFIMNTLAAIIAGYGLLANSPAVVIGAMLVAMMLGPISGVALALIDNRRILLGTSLKTLIGGVGAVIAVGVVLGFIHNNISMTDEILGRTQPNIMDLMIALAGGAAGAFASISPRLSVAVVGVAVATALVPPLVATGILFAHFEWRLACGAFLLAFTNMIAIQFSSSLVLWIAGFRRVSDEEKNSSVSSFLKRNVFSLLLLALLGVYLTINLLSTIEKQRYESLTKQQITEFFSHENNSVDSVKYIPKKEYLLIQIVIQGDKTPHIQDIQQIEKSIERSPKGLPAKLQVKFVPAITLQTTPLLPVSKSVTTH